MNNEETAGGWKAPEADGTRSGFPLGELDLADAVGAGARPDLMSGATYCGSCDFWTYGCC